MHNNSEITVNFHFSFIVLISVFILGCFFRTPVSQFWGNIGMLYFNHIVSIGTNIQPEYTEAQALFERGIVNHSTDQTVWRGLGFILMLQHKKNEAINVWENDPSIASELVLWGLNSTTNQFNQNEIEWFDSATKVNPQLVDAWYYMGILENDSGNYFSALDAYEEALAIVSSYNQETNTPAYSHQFDRVELSDIYYRLGTFYEQEHDFKDIDLALKMYDQALTINSFGYVGTHAQAFYRRGVLYEENGYGLAKSIAEYEKALDIYPEHGWAKLRLGYTLYREHRNVAQAEQILYEVISSKIDDTVYQKLAYQYLGDIYRNENRSLDAIAAYRQALMIDPTDEKVAQLLVDLLAKQKSR